MLKFSDYLVRRLRFLQFWGLYALTLCFLGAAAAPGTGQTGQEPAARRPNILFLFPDNMRAQAMACMGNPDVRTPNLDRLAAEGILFRQTFSNGPECSPARAMMLTGKYTHSNGMTANDLRLRESEDTIADLLAAEGYRTGFIGKWHLDGGNRNPGFVPPGPRRQGFQFWAAHKVMHKPFENYYFRDDETPIRMDKFETEGWTDLAIEFLRGTKKDQPFFLMVGMGSPHPPYTLGKAGAPEKYMKMYDPKALTMRPNFKGIVNPVEYEAISKEMQQVMERKGSFDHVKKGAPFTPHQLTQVAYAFQERGFLREIEQNGRKEIAGYYAAVTAIDDQVGRLMRTLDELGLAEDTIFLFTSDHGNMLGSQEVGFVMQHMKPWDEAARVPGIVRYPRKVKPGQQLETFFSLVDMAPSLLSLCGVDIPKDMQGTDLSPVILGEKGEEPDSVFFQLHSGWRGGFGGEHGGWRGIRTHRYMYVRWPDRPRFLYDMEKDPYQLHTLVNEPAAAAVMKELDQKLEDWMRRTGDSWKYNWTAHEGYLPVQEKARLFSGAAGFETFYTIDEYFQWASEHPDLVPAE